MIEEDEEVKTVIECGVSVQREQAPRFQEGGVEEEEELKHFFLFFTLSSLELIGRPC